MSRVSALFKLIIKKFWHSYDLKGPYQFTENQLAEKLVSLNFTMIFGQLNRDQMLKIQVGLLKFIIAK